MRHFLHAVSNVAAYAAKNNVHFVKKFFSTLLQQVGKEFAVVKNCVVFSRSEVIKAFKTCSLRALQ